MVGDEEIQMRDTYFSVFELVFEGLEKHRGGQRNVRASSDETDAKERRNHLPLLLDHLEFELG